MMKDELVVIIFPKTGIEKGMVAKTTESLMQTMKDNFAKTQHLPTRLSHHPGKKQVWKIDCDFSKNTTTNIQ